MNSFAKSAISGWLESNSGLDLNFNVREPETGITYRTYLAQGLMGLQKGRLVLITWTPVRMSDGPAFVAGGALRVQAEYGRAITEKRRIDANFIGVSLDIFSKYARPLKNDEDDIVVPTETVFSLFDAIITAESAYQEMKKENRLDEFFTQGEMDKAINWLYFGQT